MTAAYSSSGVVTGAQEVTGWDAWGLTLWLRGRSLCSDPWAATEQKHGGASGGQSPAQGGEEGRVASTSRVTALLTWRGRCPEVDTAILFPDSSVPGTPQCLMRG